MDAQPQQLQKRRPRQRPRQPSAPDATDGGTAVTAIELDSESCAELRGILLQQLQQSEAECQLKSRRPAVAISTVDDAAAAGLIRIVLASPSNKAVSHGNNRTLHQAHRGGSMTLWYLVLRSSDVSTLVECGTLPPYLAAVLQSVGETRMTVADENVTVAAATPDVICVNCIVVRVPPTSPKRLQEAQAIAVTTPPVVIAAASPNRKGVVVRLSSFDVVSGLDDVGRRLLHAASYGSRLAQAHSGGDQGHRTVEGHHRRKQRKCDVSNLSALYTAMLSEMDGMSDRRAVGVQSGASTRTMHHLCALAFRIVSQRRAVHEEVDDSHEPEAVLPLLASLARAAGYGESQDIGVAMARRVIGTISTGVHPEAEDAALQATLGDIDATFAVFLKHTAMWETSRVSNSCDLVRHALRPAARVACGEMTTDDDALQLQQPCNRSDANPSRRHDDRLDVDIDESSDGSLCEFDDDGSLLVS